MEELFEKLEEYSSLYQFNFQFWGTDNNNVFIEKNFIELTSGGGFETIQECIQFAIDYVERINPKIIKIKS